MDGLDGFSREIVEPDGMNGFSRMNNIIDGYTLSGEDDFDDDELDDLDDLDDLEGYTLSGLNGRSMRKIKRFYRRTAPWGYIGTAVAGLLVLDIATGGKVRETFGMKKKKKR